MKKCNYIGFLFFLAIGKLTANTDSLYDSSNLSFKHLPRKPSEIYTGKDFNYEEAIQQPNILMRIFWWIYSKILELLNKLFDFDLKADTASGMTFLWISLSVLLVILLVVGFFFFYKKFHKTLGRSDKDYLTAEEAEKNIHEADFDTLIQTAVTEGNYRLAVRFYYLKILKLMADHQMIEYQYQKTNYEYYYEISNPELKNLFKEISYVFDYCWYGDHQAKEADFYIAKNKFSEVEYLLSKL